MRSSTALRLATTAALLVVVAGCSSSGSEDPALSPTPTPEAAGWPVYDGPPAPDLVVRAVPLAAGVGRGLDDVDRVERIGEVAVISGRNERHDLTRAVDLASGRVLWQRRSGQSVDSALGPAEVDGGWAAVPARGLLVGTSYRAGCETGSEACGSDPRREEPGEALHAVDARTGTVRWSVPLLPTAPGRELGNLPYGVDHVASAGAVVVVNLVDDRGEAALVQGYDAATGRRLWEKSGAWASGTSEELVLTNAISDPDDPDGSDGAATVGAWQGRDARTGRVLWTNPDLPADEFPDASGGTREGIGKTGNTFFSLADGHVIARATQFTRVASGADGSYGVGKGPQLDEEQCCISTVATVGPDGEWRRSEHAVGRSVEWADGDHIWRSLDNRGDGLVAVDRTGAARSRELAVPYGAQFSQGLILSAGHDGVIRMWTYRPG